MNRIEGERIGDKNLDFEYVVPVVSCYGKVIVPWVRYSSLSNSRGGGTF